MGGAIIQWRRDGLGIIDSAPQVEQLAASVPDTGGVVLVPAFTGLGAPHWDPYARGTIVGLSRGSHRGHIARAALESIAYQSCDVLDAMQKDATVALQFQADMLGVPVVRPAVTETTALGAAYLAGLATGFWQSRQEMASQWRQERCFMPAMGADERAARLHVWRRALERARHWDA
jgi:glycerol kinase